LSINALQSRLMRRDSLHRHIAVTLLYLVYCKKRQKELRNWTGCVTCRIARVQMLHSADAAHSLHTGVLYCQNVTRFHGTLLPNLIHAHTFLKHPLYRNKNVENMGLISNTSISTDCNASISTKHKNSTWHYVDISNTEQNRSKSWALLADVY